MSRTCSLGRVVPVVNRKKVMRAQGVVGMDEPEFFLFCKLASRFEAIAIRLEALAFGLEALGLRLEAMALGLRLGVSSLWPFGFPFWVSQLNGAFTVMSFAQVSPLRWRWRAEAQLRFEHLNAREAQEVLLF